MKRNLQTGVLEVPEIDGKMDISQHGKECEDYYTDCINHDRLTNRMKELDEKLEQAHNAAKTAEVKAKAAAEHTNNDKDDDGEDGDENNTKGKDGDSSSGSISDKYKKDYPKWYLNCKGDEDEEDGGGYSKPDVTDKAAMELLKLDMAANGMQSAYMMNAEREKLKKQIDERKERTRTEKLARITRLVICLFSLLINK